MNFFQITPLPSNQIEGYYDIKLVFLSYIVAIFASFVALSITGNLRSSLIKKFNYWKWFIGGACVMGTGIWTMHFIGMEAFILPIPMKYDPLLTFLSLGIAIVAAGFALSWVTPSKIPLYKILIGGVLMGLGIASMHYTGMAAMGNIKISYIPSLFFLSIIIAIVASQAALWLMIKTYDLPWAEKLIVLSALVMGSAICGMHYVGMAAAVIAPDDSVVIPSLSKIHSHSGLPTYYIGVSSFLIMMMFLSLSSNNRKFLVSLQKSNEILRNKEIELKQARDRAEQANIAKTFFLANISHEIRTPLNVIIGAASLLSHSSLNEKDQNYVNRITLSSQLLLNLITDILDFSKIEAGEMKFSIKRVEFVPLVKEVVDLMIDKAEEKKLKLIFNDNLKDPLLIITDPIRIQQVITNLISNAIKFTEKGSITVSIVPKLVNDHLTVRVEVQDTGIGISEKDSESIFKKFSQVDNTYTRKYGGAGLGLAICKELLELLGGKIGYISKPGEGSIFWFEISSLDEQDIKKGLAYVEK